YASCYHRYSHSFPTRRSSDLLDFGNVDSFLIATYDNKRRFINLFNNFTRNPFILFVYRCSPPNFHRLSFIRRKSDWPWMKSSNRSEEHTSELQSRFDLVCRLL